MKLIKCLLALLGSLLCFASATSTSHLQCDVRMRIDSGWVCGLRRLAEYDVQYASFRGIPYAQQPVGELRFKELQPVKPWHHHLDATVEGPVCPQHYEIYGRLINPYWRMSESCIHVNVHVPIGALAVANDFYIYNKPKTGLPILVFIHGGAFQSGSGDADLHGPEYLVSKGIIVITFNYRLNVFGFLTLNSSKIPGNNGLRDQVTLLRWVQRNARAFGGNPDDVTLAGHSSGAACAHLLFLSKVAQGLFKRVILMSGTALPAVFTTSPVYASMAANRFLSILGINSTDPDLIHEQLIKMPLEKILNANSIYQRESGLVSFIPVLEPEYPGVTQIIDDSPINLIKQGRGKNLPLLIGFTNKECQLFNRRTENIDIFGRINRNPLVILPAGIPFSTTPYVTLDLANKVAKRYFHKNPTLTKHLDKCRDTLIEYPAFKVAEWRAKMKAAPVFLYQFSYESDYNVGKVALDFQYRRCANIEDLTYIFRMNAILGHERFFPPTNRDDLMKDWMTQFVVNFMRCNNPTCGVPGWLPVYTDLLNYQNIYEPAVYCNSAPTPDQQDRIKFFDKINEIASNSSAMPPPTISPKEKNTTEYLPVKVIEINGTTTTERVESKSNKTVDINSFESTTEKEEDIRVNLPVKVMEINGTTTTERVESQSNKTVDINSFETTTEKEDDIRINLPVKVMGINGTTTTERVDTHSNKTVDINSFETTTEKEEDIRINLPVKVMGINGTTTTERVESQSNKTVDINSSETTTEKKEDIQVNTIEVKTNETDLMTEDG